MDALTAHVFALFGLCTAPATRAALLPVRLFSALIVGGILHTGGLNNPGFVYRIRQAVCKLSVRPLCTEGLARHGARSSDTRQGVPRLWLLPRRPHADIGTYCGDIPPRTV